MIPDEAVEAAARELSIAWGCQSDAGMARWRERLRVALEAAAPHLMAPYLKLAEDMENAISGGPEFIGKTGLRFNAAERLREMATNE